MKIVGIVTEYNPFHKGHAYQLQKVREIYGTETAIVCVMSGDFVQRGEPAVFSKFARAEAAVHCGADLIIEMPLHISIGSAERFADGAVRILGGLGVVDYLVFGSEGNDVALLERTAACIDHPDFDCRIKQHLESGCSYPSARSKVLQEMMDGEDVTCMPNDNLGVEYIRAIKRHGFNMIPQTILRKGAMHDQVYDGAMKSGSELRLLLQSGKEIFDFIPQEAYDVYLREIKQGKGPVFLSDMETAILSRLRMMSLEEFAALPDASEGLEHKVYKACRREASLNSIYDSVKTKRYTHARIRRMTMCAALGITSADYDKNEWHARIWALHERGAGILRISEKQRSVSVLSKPAAARKLDEAQLEMFRKSADAHDLYVLCYSNQEQRYGERDWITSPVFIK